MKKILIATLAIGLITAEASAVYAASERIAYVDAETVFDRTKLGRKYQGIVRQYFESRKRILDLDADEINKRREDYAKQKNLMQERTRKEKEEVIARLIDEFSKKRNQFNDEISAKNTELTNEFNQEINRVLAGMKQRGYTIILLHSSFVAQLELRQPEDKGSEVDLTDKVIAEMDTLEK